MKGCDERCSFCIVPYTRGPERYRPSDEIVAEIAALVAAGVARGDAARQTVNSYRDPLARCRRRPASPDDPDESEFAALLRRIASRRPGARAPPLHEPAPAPPHAVARARARRARRARAARAPAGAVGQRPHAEAHDPALHAGRVRRARRALLAARARPDALDRHHRRLPRRDRGRLRGDARRSCARSASRSSSASSTRRGRYTPALKLADDVPEARRASASRGSSR